MNPPTIPVFPPFVPPAHRYNLPPDRAVEERGSHFAAEPAAAPSGPTPAQLRDLITLDVFDEAVNKARSNGGPTAALQALLQCPVQVGPWPLYPVTVSVSLFLQALDSPLLTDKPVGVDNLAEALIAFTGPERTGQYLTFSAESMSVDRARLRKDAWTLAGQLNHEDLAKATNWITIQMSGLASLFPAGEEAGNFPRPEAETGNPPPTKPPVQAPPAGSLS